MSLRLRSPVLLVVLAVTLTAAGSASSATMMPFRANVHDLLSCPGVDLAPASSRARNRHDHVDVRQRRACLHSRQRRQHPPPAASADRHHRSPPQRHLDDPRRYRSLRRRKRHRRPLGDRNRRPRVQRHRALPRNTHPSHLVGGTALLVGRGERQQNADQCEAGRRQRRDRDVAELLDPLDAAPPGRGDQA